MAKKAKGFGVNTFVKAKRKKRPGRHSKKHKKTYRGQGKPWQQYLNIYYYVSITIQVNLMYGLGKNYGVVGRMD